MGPDSTRDRLGIVYLAGGVDGLRRDQACEWRQRAAERLLKMGLASFSPAHAFRVGLMTPEVARNIKTVNGVALDVSVAVLVNLTYNSHGTPLECRRAVEMDKPVFAFGGATHSVYKYDYTCWAVGMTEALEAVEQWLQPRDSSTPTV